MPCVPESAEICPFYASKAQGGTSFNALKAHWIPAQGNALGNLTPTDAP